jgi:hypothetical protein
MICKHCLAIHIKKIVSILTFAYPIAQATCWENKTIKKRTQREDTMESRIYTSYPADSVYGYADDVFLPVNASRFSSL